MSAKGKDSLLGNKIAAGLLTAGLIFWGANRIADIVVPDEAPKTPAIQLTGLQPAAAPVAAPSGPESILPLLASADVAKGQAFVQEQCAACHTLTQGGANGVGPNLYGVLGRPMFATAGFTYSDAAKGKAKGNWNYDAMNAWLSSPASFAPGTAMSYAGIHNTQTRADVVAYLRTLSATPLPLPSAAAVQAASTPAAAPSGAPGGAPAAPSLGSLFAAADLSKGKAVAQQECSACHTLTKGGAAGFGPNLYGIVGAKAFSQAGFHYSDAVKGKAGIVWTPETISTWLQNPQAFAPGTTMSFAGLKNDQTRADVIAWLNSNSDHPVKLPGK
jgi:cytochrome c